MFCKTCADKAICKKICAPLEKYLKKTCGTKQIRSLVSIFKDNAETARSYNWAGGQDKDFVDSNLSWD